jgi:hypothetical protein
MTRLSLPSLPKTPHADSVRRCHRRLRVWPASLLRVLCSRHEYNAPRGMCHGRPFMTYKWGVVPVALVLGSPGGV